MCVSSRELKNFGNPFKFKGMISDDFFLQNGENYEHMDWTGMFCDGGWLVRDDFFNSFFFLQNLFNFVCRYFMVGKKLDYTFQ